ncbi:5346_t:CDS:2, partial [Gigaspora rosea]
KFVELPNNGADNKLWSLVEYLEVPDINVAALSTPIPENIENVLIDHVNGLKPEGKIDLKTISTSDDIYKKARGGRAKTISEIVFKKAIPINQEFLL